MVLLFFKKHYKHTKNILNVAKLARLSKTTLKKMFLKEFIKLNPIRHSKISFIDTKLRSKHSIAKRRHIEVNYCKTALICMVFLLNHIITYIKENFIIFFTRY